MNPVSRWLQKRRVEREMAAEIAEHLAEKIDQLRDEGHSEEEARALARRQFGNTTLQQEDSRAAWGWNTVEQFWQDTRFGWRVLTKTPAFTATAVIVLALGIGMNTAMFSAVKAVLLSALPYPEPERMVELRQTAKDGHMMNVSGLDFRDWRAQSRTIEYMAAYGIDAVTLSGSFPARRARMAAVGSGFFDVVATHAAIGRTFSAGEQKPGGTPTLVFGYELAEAVFGAPANAIQKTVRLNGMAFTVIGVMPPKFNFPDNAQLWLPNDLFPDETGRSAHNYRVIGRLKPGVTVSQAQADMDVVAARLAKEYADDRDEGIRVTSLFEFLTGGVRPALLTLFGAVTLVLLIACVNISNLQLARAAARRKEMGMRSRIGSGARTLDSPIADRKRLACRCRRVARSGAGGIGGENTSYRRAGKHPAHPKSRHRSPACCASRRHYRYSAGLLFGVLPSLDSSKTDVNDALKQGAGKGEGVRQNAGDRRSWSAKSRWLSCC